MNKKLLILGGIPLSKEIIDQAHKMNVDVYITDYLEDSPAKKFADKSFMVSTTDVDAVVELIQKENIDGVITGYVDMLLPYYVEIAEKSGLPCYATKEQIAITTDKKIFKSKCKEFSIPVVKEYDFYQDQLDEIKYPVIVKPVDNSGARGIYICKDKEELIDNYNKSLVFSKSKQVLIEQFMNNEEATIFYLLNEGEIYLTAMADRHMHNFDNSLISLPIGYTFPSKYIKTFQQELNPKIIEMFKSLGMKNGMVFIQTFIEEGKCIVYEMGYRLTGSIETHIIEKALGINPLEYMINFALGNKNHITDYKINPDYSSYFANMTFLLNPGRIKNIKGINEIETNPNLIHLFQRYNTNDLLTDNIRGTLAQAFLRVLIKGESKESLIETMDIIKDKLDVIDSENMNMLLNNFRYKDLIK